MLLILYAKVVSHLLPIYMLTRDFKCTIILLSVGFLKTNLVINQLCILFVGCGRASFSGFSTNVAFLWLQWGRYGNVHFSLLFSNSVNLFVLKLFPLWQFPTGLALSIEKNSRRIEISLYCLARAVKSFFTSMTDAGYIKQSKKLKRADVIIFSVLTAIIMHCYAQERDVFRSKYLNVLDWVFGDPPECEKGDQLYLNC